MTSEDPTVNRVLRWATYSGVDLEPVESAQTCEIQLFNQFDFAIILIDSKMI